MSIDYALRNTHYTQTGNKTLKTTTRNLSNS